MLVFFAINIVFIFVLSSFRHHLSISPLLTCGEGLYFYLCLESCYYAYFLKLSSIIVSAAATQFDSIFIKYFRQHMAFRKVFSIELINFLPSMVFMELYDIFHFILFIYFSLILFLTLLLLQLLQSFFPPQFMNEYPFLNEYPLFLASSKNIQSYST